MPFCSGEDRLVLRSVPGVVFGALSRVLRRSNLALISRSRAAVSFLESAVAGAGGEELASAETWVAYVASAWPLLTAAARFRGRRGVAGRHLFGPLWQLKPFMAGQNPL